MNSYEELDMCIELEKKCSALYGKLGTLFPETESLFTELAIEEENHAVILKVAKIYITGNKLRLKSILPVSIDNIKESLEIADKIMHEIESGAITLKKALDMSLLLEKSLGESYLHEAMAGEEDPEIMAKLRKMHFDEDSHIRKIQDFKAGKGLE